MCRIPKRCIKLHNGKLFIRQYHLIHLTVIISTPHPIPQIFKRKVKSKLNFGHGGLVNYIIIRSTYKFFTWIEEKTQHIGQRGKFRNTGPLSS